MRIIYTTRLSLVTGAYVLWRASFAKCLSSIVLIMSEQHYEWCCDGECVVTVQEDLMSPSLFICSECKEIEEDQTNVVTCAECGVGSEFRRAASLADTGCLMNLLLNHGC